MRQSFIDTLSELAKEHSNLYLLTADLGFSFLEPFQMSFPDRYINVGVAEQNMISVATGLSLENNIVFTYSIANFTTFRCLEQIRCGPCYHNLNVKMVGSGGGYSYSSTGYTHHGLEDIAILKSLPNISIFTPADPAQTKWVTKTMLLDKSPAYLRLEKSNDHLFPKDYSFCKSGIHELCHGTDLTIITYGSITKLAMSAADELKGEGIDTQVITLGKLHPLDINTLESALSSKNLLVVEEHGPNGLYSTICEIFINKKNHKIKGLFVPLPPLEVAGDQDYLRSLSGLDKKNIVKTAKNLLALLEV